LVWICLLGGIDAIRDGKAEGGVAHKEKILDLWKKSRSTSTLKIPQWLSAQVKDVDATSKCS